MGITVGPWAAAPAAIFGFFAGWLSALLTERLTPAEDAPRIWGRNMIVRDPLVQGSLALLWAAMPLTAGGDVLHWLEGGLLAVPLVQVAVTDLRSRYVYTVIAAVGVAFGLAFGWHYHGVEWWWSVIGAVGGGLAFTALYWLGRLMYHGGEPLARGDIYIAAMVGAVAASLALTALVYGVIASGLLAVGMWILKRSRHAYMPYGPGLCLGGLIVLFLH